MSRTARVEEVSDSDSDPEEMDIDDIDAPILAAAPPSSSSSRVIPTFAANSLTPSNAIPSTSNSNADLAFPSSAASDRDNRDRSKRWQCVYPVYFDASRSKAQGRRVGKDLAVVNPLAQDVVDACSRMGLSVVFEPGKTHPKDWANPGRARVLVKKEGEVMSRKQGVENKHHLYIKVAQYLKQHPTTEDSPMRLRIPGMPPTAKAPPPPAVPRGWKMGTVLPLHSAAVTGGGVSDNLFKDMMAEMQAQGQLPPGVDATGGAPGGKAKKEKKKIKG